MSIFSQFIPSFNTSFSYLLHVRIALYFFALMKYILVVALCISLASCEKNNDETPPRANHPEMIYKNLSNRVVNITTPAGIDINNDGPSDVWFEIWHTHDNAQNSDHHRFAVSAGEHSKLLVNTQHATPILSEGDSLDISQNTNYNWQAPASVDLAKRTLVKTTGTITWEGAWKDVQHKYLPVQINQNNSVYNGWIELSFDTAREKVILYRSAISKEANKDIIIGQ
jgi:hypothetical protein